MRCKVIDEKEIKPGVVISGKSGPDRKIISRDQGDIVYRRRVKDGLFAAHHHLCWISTICGWGHKVVSK